MVRLFVGTHDTTYVATTAALPLTHKDLAVGAVCHLHLARVVKQEHAAVIGRQVGDKSSDREASRLTGVRVQWRQQSVRRLAVHREAAWQHTGTTSVCIVVPAFLQVLDGEAFAARGGAGGCGRQS